MVYPNPLKIVSRKLTDNIVLSVSGFKRVNKINFGARMALFNYDNAVVVWSALPYGENVSEALEYLTGKATNEVAYLIIPDKEHTMAAKLFKAQFPSMKIIAMEHVSLGEDTPIDYVVTSKYAHKTIDKTVLEEEIGITDPVITNNFEFVYLPDHTNKELVMYDKNSKTLFEADLLFNLRSDEKLEQFSTELGYSENFSPHTGWSFVTRYLNPDSSFGNFLTHKATNLAASAFGLRNIYKWDFDRIVMCHGNVIESQGKTVFRKVFGSVLD